MEADAFIWTQLVNTPVFWAACLPITCSDTGCPGEWSAPFLLGYNEWLPLQTVQCAHVNISGHLSLRSEEG